jgi:hypothetical protein
MSRLKSLIQQEGYPVSLCIRRGGQGGRAQETGASVSLHQPTSGFGKALIVDTGRTGSDFLQSELICIKCVLHKNLKEY